jgi:dihydroorotate dehydrogenase electron transfer subunit
LAQQLASQAESVTVVIGAGTATGLMLVDRFTELGCTVHLATDDGSAGRAGTVVEAAMPLIDSGAHDAVYACGPEGMLIGLARSCSSIGMPCQVSLERYMRCGIGLCGSCHCGELLVCYDGPVVNGETFLNSLT